MAAMDEREEDDLRELLELGSSKSLGDGKPHSQDQASSAFIWLHWGHCFTGRAQNRLTTPSFSDRSQGRGVRVGSGWG
jgi:hypothetical protein